MFALRQDEILRPHDETRAIRIGLAGILLLAVVFRGFGINFGLPFLYDPDESVFVTRAGSILANRDFNPHFFGHPGTPTIYLLSGLYALIYLVGAVFGAFDGVQGFKSAYFQDPTLFYLSGRILFACFGIASVLLLFHTVKRAFGSSIGLLSALILAVSPIHVQFSKLIRTDILMTFLLLVVLWHCQDIVQKHNNRSFFMAGFFLGLGVVTKYPAIIGASMIAAAAFGARQKPSALFRKLSICAAACILGMFLGSPFLFIDHRAVVSDFYGENLSASLNATGEGFLKNWFWYVRGPLVHELSVTGLVFVLLGLVSLVLTRKKYALLFLAFPFFFLCFIATLQIRWYRWIIPLSPFVAIYAACGFDCAVSWMRNKIPARRRTITILLLFGLLVLPMARLDILGGIMAHNKDTRTLARDWIVKHVPRGSRLLVEEYTCQLPAKDYVFFIVDGKGNCVPFDRTNIQEAVFKPPTFHAGSLRDVSQINKWKIDYLVLGNWHDRFMEDSRRFPEYLDMVKNYKRLMELGIPIYEVNRVTHYNQGPPVRIYRIRADWPSFPVRKNDH